MLEPRKRRPDRRTPQNGVIKCGGRLSRFLSLNSGGLLGGRGGSSWGNRFWLGRRGAIPFWFGLAAYSLLWRRGTRGRRRFLLSTVRWRWRGFRARCRREFLGGAFRGPRPRCRQARLGWVLRGGPSARTR